MKRRRTMVAKRRYKVRVLTQPTPTTPTSTAPTPTVATVSTQTPIVRSTAESVPVTVYKLATGQFAEVPCPSTLNDNSNPPPLEDIPSAPVRQGTPWPNAGAASENLFETRKDWPIPPTPVPTPTPTIKTEEPPKIAAIPHAMVIPKQTTEKCSWGLHCPIYKNDKEHGEEDWSVDMQNQLRMHPPYYLHLQPQNTQCPQPQGNQHPKPQPQSFQYPQLQNSQQSFDVPDRYAKEIKLRREWEERIRCSNEKYKLDYYSGSESDTDSEPEPDYRYEHEYMTLI